MLNQTQIMGVGAEIFLGTLQLSKQGMLFNLLRVGKFTSTASNLMITKEL